MGIRARAVSSILTVSGDVSSGPIVVLLPSHFYLEDRYCHTAVKSTGQHLCSGITTITLQASPSAAEEMSFHPIISRLLHDNLSLQKHSVMLRLLLLQHGEVSVLQRQKPVLDQRLYRDPCACSTPTAESYSKHDKDNSYSTETFICICARQIMDTRATGLRFFFLCSCDRCMLL